MLPPVGPAPLVKLNPVNQGYLVVYSAWSAFVDPGECGHHSRYKVSSDDGTVSKEVLNHSDRFDEGPVRLPLAPGSYRVSARSAHSGRVIVPVIIKERQTTFVYLDGSSHPEASLNSGTNAVKLPDGEIVGWLATGASSKAD